MSSMEALIKQVNMLQAQLKGEENDYEQLYQVEYLTGQVENERKWREKHKSQVQRALVKIKELYGEKIHLQQQLEEQERREKHLMIKYQESQTELEKVCLVNEDLVDKLDEMDAQLQKAEDNYKEQCDQTDYLTGQVKNERKWREKHKSQVQRALVKIVELYGEKVHLHQQLEELQIQLSEQQRREEDLVCKDQENQTELENLSLANEALVKKLDEMNTQRQKAEDNYKDQCDQTDYMIGQLAVERKCRQKRKARLQKELDKSQELYGEKVHLQQQLEEQERREKHLMIKYQESQTELEKVCLVNEDLVDKLDEMDAQLQKAEDNYKEQCDQTDYLTGQVENERKCREKHKSQVQRALVKIVELYGEKVHLHQQLEELQIQLSEQQRREEDLVCKDQENQTELENLSLANEALVKKLEEMNTQHQKAEERNAELSTNLEKQNYDYGQLQCQMECLTKDLHMERDCREKQEALLQKEYVKSQELCTLKVHLQQQLEEMQTQLSEQKSREEYMVHKQQENQEELEDLKQQICQLKATQEDNQTLRTESDQLIKDLKLQICQLQATEKTFHTESEQLTEELNDQVCQHEKDESSTVSQDPELIQGESSCISQEPGLVEETEVSQEQAAEKKKNPSFLKRTRHFLGLRKRKKDRNKSTSKLCPK